MSSQDFAPGAINIDDEYDKQFRLDAFDRALRVMEKVLKGQTASAMPTALKLRQWETPLMEYAIQCAMWSSENRQVVVQRLLENIESGSGHFSINRAKQAIKQVAKQVGFARLSEELASDDPTTRHQAAELLGWLKSDKAIEPLFNALMLGPSDDRAVLRDVLKAHYSRQLDWFIKRKLPEHQQSIPDITRDSTPVLSNCVISAVTVM